MVETLKTVRQEGTVGLFRDVLADLDHIIGRDPQQVPVERGVMELVECQTVLDPWFSFRFCVGHDMSRVQQFLVAQPAKGTLLPIGSQHPLPEGPLVQPLADGRGM